MSRGYHPYRSMRAVVVAMALVAAFAAPFAAPVAAEPLELETVEFFSPAVDRTMKYNIVLPHDYDGSSARYPVLYLLHGLTQNYTAWGLSNGTPFYAGLYDDLIVVMPDAGNSWYVNWTAEEGGQQNNWEDHIITDVVNHVDWNFRTIARREGRAITGLSMGGYGAITLGLRHPEMFISIGSTSGALEHARQIARRMRGESPPRQAQQRSAAQEAERAARLRRPNPLIGIDGFSSQAERSPDGQERGPTDCRRRSRDGLPAILPDQRHHLRARVRALVRRDAQPRLRELIEPSGTGEAEHRDQACGRHEIRIIEHR